MKIAVAGTGYVGLSNAMLLAQHHEVIAVDIIDEKVTMLNNKQSPIVDAEIEHFLANKALNFRATTDKSVYQGAEFVIIATPTDYDPKNNYFDTSSVESVIKDVMAVNPKAVMVIKSTVPVGYTERIKQELNCENIIFSPEFLREGSALDDFLTPDRIILGHDDQKTLVQLEEIYSPWKCDKIKVNTRTAEMTKYACNSLLAIQISSTNELANICSSIGGIDITDVMQGVHTDKFWNPILESSKRANPEILSYLKPGCGFGGSCFPKDLKAIRNHSKKLGLNPHILNAVLKVNDNQPYQIINLLKQSFSSIKDKKLLILGLSFKPNTDDVRESVSIKIINELVLAKAKIIAHDPVAIQNAKKHININTKVDFSEDWLSKLSMVDAVVILTNWEEYKQLSDSSNQPKLKNKIIIDSRRLFNPTDFPDAQYQTVGRNI